MNPILLSSEEGGEIDRVGFITYFRAEYGLYTLQRDEPLYVAATSDFGAPGSAIDFQAPLTHTLIAATRARRAASRRCSSRGVRPSTSA